LTFAELDLQSRMIAAMLQHRNARGARTSALSDRARIHRGFLRLSICGSNRGPTAATKSRAAASHAFAAAFHRQRCATVVRTHDLVDRCEA
jgi:hypothetical protein